MKKICKLFTILLFVFMLTSCIGETLSYTVKFNTLGGSEVEDVVIDKGANLELPEAPTKEGYEFGGWYTEESLVNLYLEGTEIKKDLTLYAKWIKKCTISFVTNSEVELEDVVLKSGEKLTEPSVTKEGYVFLGWYTDLALENKFSFKTEIKDDMTLYAKWIDASTAYVVKFVVDGEESSQPVTYGQTVTRPADPEKENFAFYGWYTDEEYETEYDFETEVYADMTLYGTFIQDTFVLQVSQKAEFTEFKAKKADTSEDETSFMIRTNAYLAGDDNMFKLTPVIQLGTDYDYDTEEFGNIYYGSWKYNYELQVSEDGTTYTAADKATYVEAFDEATASINFTEEAIGKFFKISVYPQLLTELQDAADYTITYEVKVIDGFNVYNAKELSYCDNRSSSHYSQSTNLDAWAKFKTANNMDLSICVSTLILQDDIQITTADFPSEFLWNEDELATTDSDYARALGSLKDYVDLYFHYAGENEEFNLYGNYFNLDASLVPCVVRESDQITAEGTAISHAQLFFIYGDTTADSSIQDVSFLGNAPKVQNAQKAGGLILAKVQGSNHVTKDIVANGWFITFFPNYTLDPYLVESCKSYDAFNSFIYNWGSPNVTIKDTIMKSAGGPIMISDHVHPENESEYIGKTNFINCEMESYVTGEEGWFSVMGVSTLVPVVKSLDAIFNQAGKSFIKTQTDGTNTYTYMNMISVNKSGSAQTATNEIVKGLVKIDENSAFCFGEDNPYLAAMLQQCFTLGAPVFQADSSTATTGYCYFNGTQLIDITGQPLSEMSLFASKYFCLYYQGMAITFELFDMGQTL